MADLHQKWQLASNVSTVIASLAATAAFIASYCFFQDTMEAQANANAVNIMNEHIKLFVENRELHDCHVVIGKKPGLPAPRPHDDRLPSYEQCSDAAEHAAFTAETILDLADGDAAWTATVDGMIRDRQWWYVSPSFKAERYDAEFVARVRAIHPNAHGQ
jgi:hypothetical protein